MVCNWTAANRAGERFADVVAAGGRLGFRRRYFRRIENDADLICARGRAFAVRIAKVKFSTHIRSTGFHDFAG